MTDKENSNQKLNDPKEANLSDKNAKSSYYEDFKISVTKNKVKSKEFKSNNLNPNINSNNNLVNNILNKYLINNNLNPHTKNNHNRLSKDSIEKIEKNNPKISNSDIKRICKLQNRKEFALINNFMHKNLLKYNTSNSDYENILLDHIIMNRNIHIVSVLKDYMIFDYKDEFLKRYYTTTEAYSRLPIFANYYQNYLKFFCIPLFRNFDLNKIAQNHGDNKAEFYYINNYGRRDISSQNINSHYNNQNINYDNVKMRSIFSETIRENIEETVITKHEDEENNFNLKSNNFTLKSLGELKINENGQAIFIDKINSEHNNTTSYCDIKNGSNEKRTEDNRIKREETERNLIQAIIANLNSHENLKKNSANKEQQSKNLKAGKILF